MHKPLHAIAALTLGPLVLAGCSSLPRSGPDDQAILDKAVLRVVPDRKPLTDYFVVDLSDKVLSYFPQQKTQSLQGFGVRRGERAPTYPLGVGDVVSITLFESAPGGLFIPAEAGSRPGNYITLPNQTVDPSGNVSVPYGGSIRASGLTAAALQKRIEAALVDRAIEPQAVVQIVESRSNQVAVLGDVNEPAKFEINPAGERILDVIARANGLSTPGVETYITLQRNGRSATVPFENLIQDPDENIFVFGNDTIYLNRERRTYLAFGASGLNGRIDFQESNLTLAEAVAQAGGLLDARADPGAVFLYRVVDGETLARMGLAADVKSATSFPVVFRVNMRDPAAFFLAQRFAMQDRDILYVSNSDSVELVKFLNLINSATSSVSNGAADYVVTKEAIRN